MASPSGTAAARGALLGILAATAFGVSAPLAKSLLTSLPPQILAGLLYAGAAVAISLYRVAAPRTIESPLRWSDWPALASIALLGGVVAPVLMLLGLERLSGVSASLLLNLEAPFTMAIAVLVFREHLGRRSLFAALLILGGAAVLKLEAGDGETDLTGVLLVALACACWALDNNLTQRLSLKDPFALVNAKTAVAATVNLSIGLVSNPTLAVGELRPFVGALALGAVSYGLSVVLDAYALRLVGAAREAAYFATGPFIGALLAVPLLGETLHLRDLGAMVVMAMGVVVLLRENHSHPHEHDELSHEHLHEHDEHHQHEHLEGDPPGSPHAHPHRHEKLRHEHPHLPDAHHRHRH